MAWWAIALIALGAAGLGVLVGYAAALLYIGSGFMQ